MQKTMIVLAFILTNTVAAFSQASDWPPEKHEHYSRNFFIETLAWLVRSGLVRRLLQETSRTSKRAVKIPRSPKKSGSAKVKDRRRRAKSRVSRKPVTR